MSAVYRRRSAGRRDLDLRAACRQATGCYVTVVVDDRLLPPRTVYAELVGYGPVWSGTTRDALVLRAIGGRPTEVEIIPAAQVASMETSVPESVLRPRGQETPLLAELDAVRRERWSES